MLSIIMRMAKHLHYTAEMRRAVNAKKKKEK